MTMMKKWFTISAMSVFSPLVVLSVITVMAVMTVTTVAAAEPLTKPNAAIILDEDMTHPDGMTVDKQGNIILAVPRAGDLGSAWLYKITKDDKVEKYFEIPAHPETGRACPLGLVFGSDGHLYIADAQQLGGDPNHHGRILRLVHDRMGKPQTLEVVITGVIQPNGLAFHNGKLYFTETQFVPNVVPVKGKKTLTSGVFAFDMRELNGTRPIFVRPYGKDSHIVMTMETTDSDRNGEWLIGANGIAFAQDGTMYVANFGDKQLLEVKLSPDGKSAERVRVCAEGTPFESVDGMKICPKGYVFFADFAGNAVHVVNPKNGKKLLLAQNPIQDSADKKAGALDRCSEVCIRDGKVYVANIDLLKELTSPHTLSVIPIDSINFDELLK